MTKRATIVLEGHAPSRKRTGSLLAVYTERPLEALYPEGAPEAHPWVASRVANQEHQRGTLCSRRMVDLEVVPPIKFATSVASVFGRLFGCILGSCHKMVVSCSC